MSATPSVWKFDVAAVTRVRIVARIVKLGCAYAVREAARRALVKVAS